MAARGASHSRFTRGRDAQDEFSCARRQDVMATAFALRNLALETQSRGKLHAHTRMTVPHGFLYVAHSRVKNAASVDVNTYVANYVAKGRSASEQWRNATVPFEA